jgi:hypothetical protein
LPLLSLDLESITSTSSSSAPPLNLEKISNDQQDGYKLDLSCQELTNADIPGAVCYTLKNNEVSINRTPIASSTVNKISIRYT